MTTPPEPKPDRPARMVGLTLLLGSLTTLAPMSIDMYLPSLPTIAHEFGTDAAAAQRTLATFLLGLACGQLIYGPLTDRVGRRRPLMIGITVYVAVTLCCIFAPSIEGLIGLRFLQALGACSGTVVARAVVADLFDRQEAARMYSLLILVLGVVPILAPIIGGWVLLLGGWRTIFAVLAGFGTIMFITASTLLAETRSPQTAARARAESPLRSYIAVLRRSHILGFGLGGALGGSAIFTFIAALPDLLIETYGIAPEHFGYLFGVVAFGFVASSQVNRHLLKQFTYHFLLQTGLIVAITASSVLVLLALTGWGGLPALMVALFVSISSLGFIMPNGVAGAMSVDPTRGGTTSATVGSMQFISGSLCATLVGVFHDGSALPMAAVILGAYTLALICLLALVGPTRARTSTAG